MFFGQYSHQLDDKGRFRIPTKFREQLGDKPMLLLGFDGCLELYKAEDYYKVIENRFASVDILDRKLAKLKRYILSNSQEVEIDKQGRAPMITVLKEKANIKKDIVSIGVGDHVEIWAKEVLEKEEDELDLDELLSSYSKD
ncbi:MAG: division/cell wall cluster transcriptional repressor MraZ [Clostridiales bacterium]|nr:division/cell wall cluster transcriptional repressor MraZ [Clostridiales bacterium]